MKIKLEVALLSFCQYCEVLRLRDVKAQLQQLLTYEKTILPDICAICDKRTSPEQSDCARIGNHGTQSKDKPSPKLSSTVKVSTPSKRQKTVPEHFDEDKGDCHTKRQRTSETSTNFSSQGDDAQHYGQSDYVIGDSNFDSQSRGSGADVDSPSGLDVSGTKVDIDRKASSYHQKSELKSQGYGDLPRKATRLSTDAIAAIQYKLKSNESDDENGMTSSDGEDDDDDDYVETQSDSNMEEVDSDDPDDKKQTLVKTEQNKESAVKKLSSSHDKKLLSPQSTEGINPEILAFTTPSDDSRRPFKCKLCIKTYFPYLLTFQLHIKTHNGKEPMKKPFKCDDCGNDYKRISELNRHKVVHSNRSDKFKCTYRNCEFTYSTRWDLKNHLEVHRGIRRHKCKACGLGFSEKRLLNVHQTVHFEDRSFACDICNSTFSHHRLLKAHQYKHVNQEKFKCDECDYTTGIKHSLTVHKERHDKKRGCHFECERCTQVLASQRFLEKHLELNTCKPPKPPAKKRPNIGYEDINISGITKYLNPKILDMMDRPNTSPFKCKHCPAAVEFKKVSPFLKHMNLTHSAEHIVELPFKCNSCDKCFSVFSKLKQHLISHSEDRSFVCIECNKRFKNKVQLLCHSKIHKAREQMCSICGACFSQVSGLSLHVKHVHNKVRPYKCRHCERTFGRKRDMQIHVQRHKDTRPWVCETCGRSFKARTDLIAHARTHSDVKRYACNMCDYRCVRADYLTKHRRTHSKERPYGCQACGVTFSLRTALVHHQRKDHGGLVTSSSSQMVVDHGSRSAPAYSVKMATDSVESSSVLASSEETRNAIDTIPMIHFTHMQGAFSR